MVLDVEYIPGFAPWSYDGVNYDLDIEVEEETQQQSQDGDVHMADGEDQDRDQGDAKQDEKTERSNEKAKLPSSSANDKPLNSGAAPSSSSSPMATLRFGSFDVMPTPTSLWAEVCVEEGIQQTTEEDMLHKEKGTTSPALLSYQEVVTTSIMSAKHGMKENESIIIHAASAMKDSQAMPEGGMQDTCHYDALSTPMCNNSKEMCRSPTIDPTGDNTHADSDRLKEKQQIPIT
ncbi:hypothetical protein D1007_54682 [Hordeum vulgare]|nr:hypothetical protein D1007_54682 [Hordeum vulgare]